MDNDFIDRLLAKFNVSIKTNPKKRKCQHLHCKTILSCYNHGIYCFRHKKYKLYIKKTLTVIHRRHISDSIKRWWRRRKS